MSVSEFSTPREEFSPPREEFAPLKEEFIPPSAEFSAPGAEVHSAGREFDQTAEPVRGEKKQKRRVTPLMLTAAAAATVVTISAVSPALPHGGSRREPYPSMPLSAERRAYVETLISTMRTREEEQLLTLAADPNLAGLLEEELIPYYQRLETDYNETYLEHFYTMETEAPTAENELDRIARSAWFDYDGNGNIRFVGDGTANSVQLDLYHNASTLSHWYDGTQPYSVTVQIIQQDIHHTYDYWLNVHYVADEPYTWSQVLLPSWRQSEDGQQMLAENGCIVSVEETAAAWPSRFVTEGTFACPRFDETGREIDYGMATIWLENGTYTVYDSYINTEPSAVVTVRDGSVVLDDQVSLSIHETDTGTDYYFYMTAASDGALITSGTAKSQEEFLYHRIRR